MTVQHRGELDDARGSGSAALVMALGTMRRARARRVRRKLRVRRRHARARRRPSRCTRTRRLGSEAGRVKHPLRWIALAVGVVVVRARGGAGGQRQQRPARGRPTPAGSSGKQAPDFTRRRRSTASRSSRELAGKTVIVNFWNSWCLPCQQEHARARRSWYAEHKNDPSVAMVGIVRDDTKHGAARLRTDPERSRGRSRSTPARKAVARLRHPTGNRRRTSIGPDGIVVASSSGP